MLTERQIVVTGVGLLSPVGIGTEATWQALLRGDSGVGPISLFDAVNYATAIAAEVKGFVPEDFLDRNDVKKTGRFIQFALAATDFAMQQANLKIQK